MTSLLSHTPLNGEQKEYVNIINTSADALLHVINDILDFSKIESGQMELDEQNFHLRESIEGVLDLFAVKAGQQGLDLIYQIDNKLPSVIVGDNLKLRQVLINLIGNAIKFTHHGEIFVKVFLKEIFDEYIIIAFEVRDTGIGIPSDKLLDYSMLFLK